MRVGAAPSTTRPASDGCTCAATRRSKLARSRRMTTMARAAHSSCAPDAPPCTCTAAAGCGSRFTRGRKARSRRCSARKVSACACTANGSSSASAFICDVAGLRPADAAAAAVKSPPAAAAGLAPALASSFPPLPPPLPLPSLPSLPSLPLAAPPAAPPAPPAAGLAPPSSLAGSASSAGVKVAARSCRCDSRAAAASRRVVGLARCSAAAAPLARSRRATSAAMSALSTPADSDDPIAELPVPATRISPRTMDATRPEL